MKFRNILLSCSLLLGIVTMNSCKKDNPTGPTIQQNWRVIKSDYPELKYAVSFDGSSFWLLNENQTTLSHEKKKTLYKEDGELLTTNIDNSLYHFRKKFSGDTLFLLADENNVSSLDNIWLLKDNSAPSEKEWVVEVSGTELMNSIVKSALCWTDGKLTILNQQSAQLLNFATKTITSNTDLGVAYRCIEYNGSKWWVSTGGDLKLINTSTGIASVVSGAAPGTIYAIAYNGTNSVYCYSYSGSTPKLFEYNILTNTFGAEFDAPGDQIMDMAFKGGKLYAIAQDYIYRINPTSWKVEKTYTMPDYFTEGIATDGVDFYVVGWNYYGSSKYFKVTLN